MVAGPAVATVAGGVVAVALFICAFVILKQVSSREACVQKRPTRGPPPVAVTVAKSPRLAPSARAPPSLISASVFDLPQQGTASHPADAALRGLGPTLGTLDSPPRADVDSRGSVSGEDSRWQLYSRETNGTGEDWSIGTTSFVFNPGDFVISGDTVRDTIFEDAAEPVSYLDRWCQGYGRVLSWVGETAGVLDQGPGDGTKSPTPQEARDEEQGVEVCLDDGERAVGDDRDLEVSPRNDVASDPNDETEELPVSCSAPGDFDFGSDGDDGDGWGSGSSGCFSDAVLPNLDGANYSFVAPGDVWPPIDYGGYVLPKLRIRTCPPDFSSPDSPMSVSSWSPSWRRVRTLSPIKEEPEERTMSITIQCWPATPGSFSLPECHSQSAIQRLSLELGLDSHVETFSGKALPLSRKGSAEVKEDDTISTWPSQELSFRQYTCNGEKSLEMETSDPGKRVIQASINSRDQNGHESVDNYSFELQTREYEEGSGASTCSLSSTDDVDLYTRHVDFEDKGRSPVWVHNCLFDAAGKQRIENKVLHME